MTKSQIIEILKRHEHEMAGHNWLIGLDESDYILCADAILALHRREFPMAELVDTGIEMPTEEEANDESDRYGKLAEDNGIPDYGVGENASLDFVRGTNWMKNEILKRNK